MKLTRVLAATLIAPLAFAQMSASSATPNWDVLGAAWWAHVQYLASDDLQGRLPGTPGFELATQYVVKQFTALGLKPAGNNGYLQQFNFSSTRLDNDSSVVELKAADKTTALKLGQEITLSTHVTLTGAQATVQSAPLVFIGYGLRLPTRHMDDYAGIDLRGKVAVFYNSAPARLQGPQRAYARIAGQRWKALKAAGVIGMITISPPRTTAPAAAADAASATPRGQRATGAAAPPVRPTMAIADPALDTLAGLQLNATVLEARAEELFTASGHTFGELKPLITAGKPLPSFPLNETVHAVTAVVQNAFVPTHNVVGELEGSDRKLKKEFIVISAHLDHLGVGRPVNGDAIYNGAMDNASGVASVIETARILAAGPRPKRSILFIALTGEEMGELGSAYFAAKPTVDKSHVVADLNMDMYLPLFPLRYLEVQGLAESTLGNDARAVAQLNDIEVQFDKQPEENRFIRSDQVNFVAQGIPALAFKFGWTPDSPEMKTFNDWVKNRYHQPSDDLNQPIDKAAAAQFDAFLAQLAVRVANAKPRPEWYPESSFAHQ